MASDKAKQLAATAMKHLDALTELFIESKQLSAEDQQYIESTMGSRIAELEAMSLDDD